MRCWWAGLPHNTTSFHPLPRRLPTSLPCSASPRCSSSTASCASPTHSSTGALAVRGHTSPAAAACACHPPARATLGVCQCCHSPERSTFSQRFCKGEWTPHSVCRKSIPSAAEDDESLTAEEKALLRFQKQRLKELAGSKFAVRREPLPLLLLGRDAGDGAAAAAVGKGCACCCCC